MSSAAPLDGQSVGNILFSLAGMTADHPTVRKFLLAVANAMDIEDTLESTCSYFVYD